ncbi:MAG: hypothetical protein KIT17_21960 [Rubrivivax sp.]|nr:hypothetical protein [Rubrivivax sp.]
MPLPVAAAVASLVLGLLVYLLDRPAGSAALLPAPWHAGSPLGLFGAAGAWLPSLVHAFSFAILTAWALPRRRGMAAGACIGWAVIDTLAELAQLPALAMPLAAALLATFDHSALAGQVGRYFTQGSFAAADVAASLAGAALAYLALRAAGGPARPSAPDAPAASTCTDRRH